MTVAISKDKLGSYLYNAISILVSEGFSLGAMEKEIGITHDEYNSIAENSFVVELTPAERGAIAREVDRENKINDIISRVKELDEAQSPYLNGYSAMEIIEDARLLDEIFRRHEKAESWVDNSDTWYLIDDCIKDVMKIRTQII